MLHRSSVDFAYTHLLGQPAFDNMTARDWAIEEGHSEIAELLGRPNIAELLEQVSVGRRSGGGESVVIVPTDSTRTESDTCISHIITILTKIRCFITIMARDLVDLSQLW